MEAQFSILSTVLLLTFVLDPFGNIPLLLAILKDIDKRKRYKIIIREALIGLAILLLFLFGGKQFLDIFHLETNAVTIAGGVIFFIIGIKLIFPGDKGSAALFAADGEPLIVPIALPMIAGPSALATLLVTSHNNPENTMGIFISLMIAWGITAVIFLISPMLFKVFKDKGLAALERLMGMLLLIMSVQMFIDGIRGAIAG